MTNILLLILFPDRLEQTVNSHRVLMAVIMFLFQEFLAQILFNVDVTMVGSVIFVTSLRAFLQIHV